MKQMLLGLGSGEVSIGDVPSPSVRPGRLLVSTRASVISGGTEGMILDFGRSNLIEKVRSQPDRVKDVLDKIATDGFAPTMEAVRAKLGETMSPGYCQAGVVIEAGDADAPFRPGDRVATNGPHAEVVRVPYHLAARVPDGIDLEAAAFTPLAAIALQGLRLAEVSLGETVVVFGLGLIGQLAVQLVRAHGCRCIGIDVDPARVRLAESSGAVGVTATTGSVVDRVRALTGGVGADAVLMTLATDSDEPMHQAAAMSRKRGRIILVGVTGLSLRRADFYEKELTFQVSCSYGPGRYDPEYEEGGGDYPLHFVRWTEQRNFEAVLRLMEQGALNVKPLVTHRYPIDDGRAAYDVLAGDEPNLGIVLTYPNESEEARTAQTIALDQAPEPRGASRGVTGVLGAGNFARRILIPAARAAGFDVKTIVSSTGVSAAVEGEEFGARFASSTAEAVFDDPDIDTVFVLTRHGTHADLARRALEAGKHVFVEKPLALTALDLRALGEAAATSGRVLMVGFNRRFAPLAVQLKEVVDRRSGPLSLVMTVNAGHVPADHWLQDSNMGGGRIVGEACHFIDLARFLIGSPVASLDVTSARKGDQRIDDIAHLSLGFADGSLAAVHYLSNGSSRFPKERIEAFFDGKTAQIDNWRRLKTWGVGRSGRLFPRKMDKGHAAELQAFAAAVMGDGGPPILLEELLEVSDLSIRAARLARGETGAEGLTELGEA